MSKIGVNANIFHVTGQYLRLINDVIVALRTHPDRVDRKGREEVKNLLTRITDEQNEEPKIQLLSVILERDLRSRTKKPKDFLRTLISELSSEHPSPETILHLETVASALDSQRTEALAKIKGD